MARLLEILSRQPRPYLQRLELDKQPERPLLQRLFSRLPQRRPGERYAFTASPLVFLAYQPQNPPLSGFSIFRRVLIGPDLWRNEPPLAFLLEGREPLLARMDPHRMPGVVTSVLLLGIFLSYLMGLGVSPVTEETAGSQVALTEAAASEATAEEFTADDEAVEAEAAPVALTPEEEMEVAGSAEVTESDTSSEEEVVIEAVEFPEPTDEKAGSADKTLIAPEKETVSATPPPASVKTTEKSAAAAPKTPEKEMETTTAASTSQEAVAEALAETGATDDPRFISPADLPRKPAQEAEEITPPAAPTSKPEAEPANSASASTPTPEKPQYLTEQRSLSILTEARYLYLSGEGTLALERIGLAISAGHIHPDHIGSFVTMELDIKDLLALFKATQSAQDEETMEAARSSFLAREEAVFPGADSDYRKKLPEPVAGGDAEPELQPAEEPAPNKELQAPE